MSTRTPTPPSPWHSTDDRDSHLLGTTNLRSVIETQDVQIEFDFIKKFSPPKYKAPSLAMALIYAKIHSDILSLTAIGMRYTYDNMRNDMPRPVAWVSFHFVVVKKNTRVQWARGMEKMARATYRYRRGSVWLSDFIFSPAPPDRHPCFSNRSAHLLGTLTLILPLIAVPGNPPPRTPPPLARLRRGARLRRCAARRGGSCPRWSSAIRRIRAAAPA